MRKYTLAWSVLVLLFFALPALAINSQPVSKPVVDPNKIFECEGPPTLDGSASYDIDGSIASFDWYLGKILYASGKTVKVTSDIANHAGSYVFTLKVTDNGQASDSRDVILTVMGNPMPHIDNLKYAAISGNGIKKRNFLTAGDVFQLEAVRGASNHGETYVWKYDQGIFQKIGDGNRVSFKVISDSIQSSPKIGVSAFNACSIESNWMEIEIPIMSLSQNSLPKPSIELPSEVYEGKRFTVLSAGSTSGQDHDEEGDSIVSWRWEITTYKGSVILRSTARNPQFTIGDSGIFTAHLWVTDSFGKIGYENLSFPVVEAQNDPSVADASATSKTAVLGQNFTLNASRSWDPDGRAGDAIKRYEWFDLTYDEKLCGSEKPICIVVFTRPGEHKIRLKVFDAGIMGEGIIYDMIINVVSSSSQTPSQSAAQVNNSAPNKISAGTLPTSGVKETPIDPQEVLRRSKTKQTEEFPTGAKPAPGLEAIAAIVAIIVIARKMKN